MRINPAVIALSTIFSIMIVFLWAITPRNPSIKLNDASQLARKNNGLTIAQYRRISSYAKNWPKEVSYEFNFNALDPSYDVSTISDSLFDPSDEFWGLPRDPESSFELIDAYCTACHSLSIVMQQRATPERWEELLIWMEEKQGMASLPAEDEKLILDYVSTYFSTSKIND